MLQKGRKKTDAIRRQTTLKLDPLAKQIHRTIETEIQQIEKIRTRTENNGSLLPEQRNAKSIDQKTLKRGRKRAA